VESVVDEVLVGLCGAVGLVGGVLGVGDEFIGLGLEEERRLALDVVESLVGQSIELLNLRLQLLLKRLARLLVDGRGDGLSLHVGGSRQGEAPDKRVGVVDGALDDGDVVDSSD